MRTALLTLNGSLQRKRGDFRLIPRVSLHERRYAADAENRKRKKIRIWMLFPLLCLCLLTGCRKSVFDGSRVTSDDCFWMEYATLNRQESDSLELCAGDALRVVLSHERGSVRVTVGLADEEPIYEGNGLTDMSFTLQIEKDGDYQIAVTGNDACGRISFSRISAGNVENFAD